MKEKLVTERQALEWTRDLWDWLAENPGKEKFQWPGWETRQSQTSECPCCGFDDIERQKNHKPHCYNCPLKRRWGKPAPGDTHFLACNRETSPFFQWKLGLFGNNHEKMAKAAKKLANLARKALKAL